MVFDGDPKERIINWGRSQEVKKDPKEEGSLEPAKGKHLPEEAASKYVLRASA